jgi:hypothetical protein
MGVVKRCLRESLSCYDEILMSVLGVLKYKANYGMAYYVSKVAEKSLFQICLWSTSKK